MAEAAKMSRADYRRIKGYNNEQMTAMLDKIYQQGYEKGYNDCKAKFIKVKPAETKEPAEKEG